MLHKLERILKAIYTPQALMGQNSTIGEVEKTTKIPYSTIRRYLDKAIRLGLVETEYHDYKATGKHVFWLSEKGQSFIAQFKELPL